jgi:hypothetical protein
VGATLPDDQPERKNKKFLRPRASSVLTVDLARWLVLDEGPTLDRETGVLPAEELAGEVGILQTLLGEPGDDPAAPDLGEGIINPQWNEEEAVAAGESSFPDDAVPVGVPHAELAEGLMARDHDGADGPAGCLAEEAREDVPANIRGSGAAAGAR